MQARKIASPNIKLALTEIDDDEYEQAFNTLSERHWNSILEKNTLKKRKKFCDYLLRKGWESEMVYSKVKELEK